MKSAPKTLTLTVHSEFKASHSLEGFETPHFHLWKIAVAFQQVLPLQKDKLIDLVYLQAEMDQIFTAIEGQYLNEVFAFQPTSENLALWVWEQVNAQSFVAPLSSVQVTLCNLEGVATGAAQVSQ